MKAESILTTGDSQSRTIRAALELLRSVASDGADRVGDMVREDFEDLQEIFSDAGPGARRALGEIKGVTRDAAMKVDRSARENAWKYMGVVAAASALTGYLLGRKRSKGIC